MSETKRQKLERQLEETKAALDALGPEPAPPNDGVTLPGAPTKAAHKGHAEAGAVSPKQAAKKALAQNRRPAGSQDKGAVKPKEAAKKALAQVAPKKASAPGRQTRERTPDHRTR